MLYFSSVPAQGPVPTERRRSRGWLWFFVILIALTITSITVQISFNLSQQLTQQKLEAARAHWREAGPRDYDLEYTIEKIGSKETFQVQVRDSKVVASTRDGQPEEPRLFRYRDMLYLFTLMEDFLEHDTQPGMPRTFASAIFDQADSHVIRYVRSVKSTLERQEIKTRLTRLEKQ